MTTSLPANVTIVDLPAGTTLAGTELFEAVQTASGTGNSVKMTAAQIATYVGTSVIPLLPAQSANAVLAGPTSGAAATPAFRALISADLPVGTGLSVLGIIGTASTSPAPIIGTQNQVLRIAANGTTLGFGAINLATTAAVTGVLIVPNGGIGTASITPRGVVLGGSNATAAIDIAPAVNTGGNILVDQGTTVNPIFRTMTGDLTLSILGTATVSTNAITYAKFQQGTGLSVLGVVGTATANYAAVSGTTDQVVRIAQNGTTLGFGAINLATSAAVTGLLAVPNGGLGTGSLSPRGVLLGGTNATAAIGIAPAVNTGGNILVDQGTTANPIYRTMTGDLTLSILGTATVSTNAITYAKFQQGTGLSVLGVVGTATANWAAVSGTTDQVMRIAANGTTLGFGAINLATAAAVTGVLAVVNGGIGTATIATGSIVVGNVAGAVLLVADVATGSILASGGANLAPVYSTTVAVSGIVTMALNSALPSGGSTTMGLKISSAANFGVFVGTGAPTLSAATSSIYFRSNPANASTRLYINTDGGSTWAGITALA